MKVLLATSFFPPTHLAGTEKLTFAYANTLKKIGHTVQVVCAGRWEEGSFYWNGCRDEIYEGIPVRRIDLNWHKSPDPNAYLYRNPRIQQHFREWLAVLNPDLVHVTSCLTLSAGIIQEIKKADLPLVLTLTDFWFVCPKLSLLRANGELCDGNTTSRECIQCLGAESRFYRRLNSVIPDRLTTEVFHWISKFPVLSRRRGARGIALNIDRRKVYLKEMLNLPDVIITLSHHLAKTILGTGVTDDIKVIQTGHDLSWLNEAVPKAFSERIRFGYIGQIIPTKGLHMMIAAFKTKDLGHQAELHIHGDCTRDPVYFDELQQIPGCNSAAIRFHGPFPHRELGKVLSGIDILIVPSLWHENNPLVIQEAYAAKRPVIASDVGGISEHVQPGRGGLLFRRGDSQDLSIQIQRIVDSPSLLLKLTQNLPEVKSIRQETDEIAAIYDHLVPNFRKSTGAC